MNKVLVEKVKLDKANKAYKRLKRANATKNILLIICFIVIAVLTAKTSTAASYNPPIIMGTGSLEKVSDSLYEIVPDDVEFEEITLPPMPSIK